MYFIILALLVGSAVAAGLTSNAAQQPLTLQLTHHWSSNETIYAALSHHKEFSKLIKAIDFADKIASVLNDTSADITFFAVPDSALRRSHKHHPEFKAIASSAQPYDLVDAVAFVEEFQASKDNKNDRDKKKFKKFLKKLVQAILEYHILPDKFDVERLAGNNTFPTYLVLPEALGSRPLRIRVAHSLVSPVPTINFYSKVVKPDNNASNGVVHVVNHPLLPPPPAFQDLFLAPSIFATFTSAIQRTGLTDLLDLRYRHGRKDEKGTLIGSNTVTVFAPTNHAFEQLPKKLRTFLFSPFGTRILRRLLQYHIVPGVVFHTDYIYNKTSDNFYSSCGHRTFDLFKVGLPGTDMFSFEYRDSCPDLCVAQFRVPLSEGILTEDSPGVFAKDIEHPEPIESFDEELPSALTNYTLHAHVEKFKFSIPIPSPHNSHIITKFNINGHRVIVPDIIGLNGAVHMIEHILDPRGHSHHGQANWEDWEEWLPQWAGEH
ncbi:hypothetical protein H2248_009718 [Termitomyces sp. 'cryptogamus']|nr:hypothetical protein H2248_009718 [Termitomyces sp. 'cryptogamus']